MVTASVALRCICAEALEEEERRLDAVMEFERVKAVKMFEEREKIRAAEQKIGAAIIIKQMQEREAERVRQQELRDQEAQVMIQRIKEMEAKEELAKRNKQIAARKQLEDVQKANNEQARSKLLKKQEEVEEDLRIGNQLLKWKKGEAFAFACAWIGKGLSRCRCFLVLRYLLLVW